MICCSALPFSHGCLDHLLDAVRAACEFTARNPNIEPCQGFRRDADSYLHFLGFALLRPWHYVGNGHTNILKKESDYISIGMINSYRFKTRGDKMDSKEPLTRALVLKCSERVFSRITSTIKEMEGCQVVFITSSPGHLIVTEKKNGGEENGSGK